MLWLEIYEIDKNGSFDSLQTNYFFNVTHLYIPSITGVTVLCHIDISHKLMWYTSESLYSNMI